MSPKVVKFVMFCCVFIKSSQFVSVRSLVVFLTKNSKIYTKIIGKTTKKSENINIFQDFCCKKMQQIQTFDKKMIKKNSKNVRHLSTKKPGSGKKSLPHKSPSGNYGEDTV